MAANATQHRSVRALCEGAIMVALAQILAYLKLYELPQGGSITLAMVPIFFFAVRWGWKKGLGCAFLITSPGRPITRLSRSLFCQ